MAYVLTSGGRVGGRLTRGDKLPAWIAGSQGQSRSIVEAEYTKATRNHTLVYCSEATTTGECSTAVVTSSCV